MSGRCSRCALVGGACNSGARCGAECVRLSSAASALGWFIGASNFLKNKGIEAGVSGVPFFLRLLAVLVPMERFAGRSACGLVLRLRLCIGASARPVFLKVKGYRLKRRVACYLLAVVGGACGNGARSGAECLHLSVAASGANWQIGASTFLEVF